MPPEINQQVDRVYSRKQTAAMLGVCTKTLQRLEQTGKLQRTQISERRVGYRASVVDAYLAAQTRSAS